MNGAEAILALMLAVGPKPGGSIYSQTVVTQDAGPGCDNKASLLCAEPVWSGYWKALVRPETKDEAIVRYWTIARAIDDATQGANAYLRPYILTVTEQESGWRKDVHSGVGPWARGDKDFSWGLGQIYSTPDGEKIVDKHFQWKAKDIVGTDYNATRRCTEVISKRLKSAHGACRGIREKQLCVFAAYGGNLSLMTHQGVIARAVKFNTFVSRKKHGVPELTDKVKKLIGIEGLMVDSNRTSI